MAVTGWPLKPKSSGAAVLRRPGSDNRMTESMFPTQYMLIRFLLKCAALLCLGVVTAAYAGAASSVETDVREMDAAGEAVEMHLPGDQSLTPWVHDPGIFEKGEGDGTERRAVVEEDIKTVKVCRTETVCKLRYRDGHSHRARVKNLIPPLHYDESMPGVPEGFLQQIRQALKNLSSKQNVVVRFTAYTDNLPLKSRDKRRLR